MKRLRLFLVTWILCIPSFALAETYLLMAEEDGCYWCQRWNTEIGHIYPKTAEGRAAPLRTYDLHGTEPEVELARRVLYTPTFILVDNGKEVGRIEGYPGEDFFWGLVGQMLQDANIQMEPAG